MRNFIASHFSSSATHRKTEKILAGTEVLNYTVLEPINPSILIPGKVSQALVSIYSIFHKDTAIFEKCVHGLQAAINIAQTTLALFLLNQNESCPDKPTGGICTALFTLQLVYAGTLLATWTASEQLQQISQQGEQSNLLKNASK